MSHFVDLHCHTIASDGLLAPTALVKKALQNGLTAIAITDHDSVSGIEEAQKAGEKYNIEIIPGIELSTTYNNKEYHLLGYFLDYKAKWFVKILKESFKERERRAKKMIQIFQELGYVVNFKMVRDIATGNIGKPHIAQAILQDLRNEEKLKKVFGKKPIISDFIQEYLRKGKIADVPKKRLDIRQGIKYIKKLQGVSVLAHPGYDLEGGEIEVRTFLSEMKNAGLDGIEAIYYKNDEETSLQDFAFYRHLASDFDLIITGGSDYHGIIEKGRVRADLGFTNMSFKVEYRILKNLKKIANQKRIKEKS